MRACAIRRPRAAAFEATGRLRPSSAGRVARRARPLPARAAFLSGDALDTVADMAGHRRACSSCRSSRSSLFWLVHVLPEKIAHKRHHPQREAITTLCLLSLVFGGLLWPLAWLWAYTKPVGYRVAYGTDKHEEYYDEMAEKHRDGQAAARRGLPPARGARGDGSAGRAAAEAAGR